MNFFCGIAFAGGLFVFLNSSYAQHVDKKASSTPANATWQRYDSLAALHAFNRDTLGALRNYRKAFELNPDNQQLNGSYERLNYLYIKSVQSFYNINR
jgi:hypothetical protein